MRYRRYYNHPNADGSRTVISHGPVLGFYRLMAPLLLLVLALAFGLAILTAIAATLPVSVPVLVLTGIWVARTAVSRKPPSGYRLRLAEGYRNRRKGGGGIIFGLLLIIAGVIQMPLLVVPTTIFLGVILNTVITAARRPASGR